MGEPPGLPGRSWYLETLAGVVLSRISAFGCRMVRFLRQRLRKQKKYGIVFTDRSEDNGHTWTRSPDVPIARGKTTI